MRISYKPLPIDKPRPLTGNVKEQWLPIVPVRVCDKRIQRKSKSVLAIVDSGSDVCLFSADFLPIVGLKLEDGEEDAIGGIGKNISIPVFFHRITILVADNWRIEVPAGFSKELRVGAILGRLGFFDSFRVTFDHSGHPPAVEIEPITHHKTN